MNKINLLLLAALLGSCMVLVKTSHEARQLFSAVDRAERENKLLEAEYRRLDAERQTQATHQKVERVARQRLHMTPPPLTVYVDPPVATGGPASPALPAPAAPKVAIVRAEPAR
jgi:cell division protein FtsL